LRIEGCGLCLDGKGKCNAFIRTFTGLVGNQAIADRDFFYIFNSFHVHDHPLYGIRYLLIGLGSIRVLLGCHANGAVQPDCFPVQHGILDDVFGKSYEFLDRFVHGSLNTFLAGDVRPAVYRLRPQFGGQAAAFSFVDIENTDICALQRKPASSGFSQTGGTSGHNSYLFFKLHQKFPYPN